MSDIQPEVLVQELNRLSSENKRLSERLSQMCESYDALQKHLEEVMNKNSSEEEAVQLMRKRKTTGNDNCLNMYDIISGNYKECSTSHEEESCKRPRINPTAPKVSKFLVRTEASDTSLVSSQLF